MTSSSITVARKSSCFILDDDDDSCSSVITSAASSFYGSGGSIRRSYSSLISSSSPRFGRMYESRFDDRRQPHFLQSCAFCRKSIAEDKDIFMYRGDTPFCSEDCREKQIDMDEAMEKRKTRMLSSINDQKSAAASKAEKYSLSPVAAA